MKKKTWISIYSHIIAVIPRNFIQVLLKEAGFNPGRIDGKLGARTKAAVLKFQEAHGLKIDGKIGYQTLGKLATFIPEEAQMK